MSFYMRDDLFLYMIYEKKEVDSSSLNIGLFFLSFYIYRTLLVNHEWGNQIEII